MKLHQILETADDDRAIIALARAIWLKAVEAEREADDDASINMGTIGDFVETPLTDVHDIGVLIMDDALMDTIGTGVAFWDPDRDLIILRKSRIPDKRAQLDIAHELRHALDDMKSNYAATDSSRYSTAPAGKDPYLAQPAEINARFVEALNVLAAFMKRVVKENPLTAKQRALERLPELLQAKRITTVFPERDKSPQYKRLLRRAVDFINKEFAHLSPTMQ